ncbi:MAG: MBL fold metallo-hydrolase [Desulfobacterium sp.]|nr:MBL fold metallo-hydrolase [Desulfobacterium sp.]
MTYSIVNPNLYLITLDQKLPGFRNFINAWLYKSETTTFLVDPGPKYSIMRLIKTLKEIGVERIDYILLTHIHIDHAGGAGALVAHYPGVKIICHPKAVGHMTAPDKLWQGSLKVLGVIAESYGEIIPVPAGAVAFQDQIETGAGDINVFETPGHAIHHLCFQFQNYLFAGEVAGVIHCLKEGIYARPATPPRFKLEMSLASLDRIIPLDTAMICYGHYGFREDVKAALKAARGQLLFWVEVVRSQLEKGEGNLKERIIATLKKEDAAFANMKYLAEDIQQREVYFVGNTLNGMKEYVMEI